MLPQPGALVRVRSRQYLVEEVFPPPDGNSQTLARLSCVDDDAQGSSLEVLWEREVDAQVLEPTTWKDLARRGFDPPARFSAYLHTLRWNLVTSTDPRLLQSLSWFSVKWRVAVFGKLLCSAASGRGFFKAWGNLSKSMKKGRTAVEAVPR